MTVDRKYNWEGEERPFFSPWRWPRWARIAFAVTLPISGPLWLVCFMVGGIATMFGMAAVFCIAGPICFAIDLFEKDRN